MFCQWRTVVDSIKNFHDSYYNVNRFGVYEYQLPKIEQLNFYNTGLDSVSLNSRYLSNFNYRDASYSKSRKHVFEKEACGKMPVQAFAYHKVYEKRAKSPINIQGNVAEMTNIEGIATGGSYFHYAKDAAINNIQYYSEPELWLGFRCVGYRRYSESQIQQIYLFNEKKNKQICLKSKVNYENPAFFKYKTESDTSIWEGSYEVVRAVIEQDSLLITCSSHTSMLTYVKNDFFELTSISESYDFPYHQQKVAIQDIIEIKISRKGIEMACGIVNTLAIISVLIVSPLVAVDFKNKGFDKSLFWTMEAISASSMILSVAIYGIFSHKTISVNKGPDSWKIRSF